jgi:hypothetical protein
MYLPCNVDLMTLPCFVLSRPKSSCQSASPTRPSVPHRTFAPAHLAWTWRSSMRTNSRLSFHSPAHICFTKTVTTCSRSLIFIHRLRQYFCWTSLRRLTGYGVKPSTRYIQCGLGKIQEAATIGISDDAIPPLRRLRSREVEGFALPDLFFRREISGSRGSRFCPDFCARVRALLSSGMDCLPRRTSRLLCRER